MPKQAFQKINLLLKTWASANTSLTICSSWIGGSILGGITRDSVLRLARSWNIVVEERPVAIDEIIAGAEDGSLKEAFATGTAAIISPIGELFFNNSRCIINNGVAGSLANRLFEDLQDIQHGRKLDPFKWTVRVG